MLQNRVNPFGELVRTPVRGNWMGNRGLLHNDKQEIIRPFKLTAWITCRLEFNNRKRKVMSPRRYTELFFLDEATAFAAGHRPCFECRRAEFNVFKSLWLKGNPEYGFTLKTPIGEIDRILQRERINEKRAKVTFEENIDQIPEGSFVQISGKAFLITGGLLHQWSSKGYSWGIALPKTDKLIMLTPRSIINTFRAGYLPQIAVLSIRG
jgi:hypothetical protein